MNEGHRYVPVNFPSHLCCAMMSMEGASGQEAPSLFHRPSNAWGGFNYKPKPIRIAGPVEEARKPHCILACSTAWLQDNVLNLAGKAHLWSYLVDPIKIPHSGHRHLFLL